MSWEIGPWQILACGEQLCVGQCIQRTSHLIQQLGCRHLPVDACGLGCRAQAEVVGARGSCLELGAGNQTIVEIYRVPTIVYSPSVVLLAMGEQWGIFRDCPSCLGTQVPSQQQPCEWRSICRKWNKAHL